MISLPRKCGRLEEREDVGRMHTKFRVRLEIIVKKDHQKEAERGGRSGGKVLEGRRRSASRNDRCREVVRGRVPANCCR